MLFGKSYGVHNRRSRKVMASQIEGARKLFLCSREDLQGKNEESDEGLLKHLSLSLFTLLLKMKSLCQLSQYRVVVSLQFYNHCTTSMTALQILIARQG